MSDFWSACLSQFERELPAQQFNTWIKSLRCEDEDDSPRRLRVLAPNRFVLQWVRERYMSKIETLGREFYGEPVDVSLGLCEALKVDAADAATDADEGSSEEVQQVKKPAAKPLPISSSRNHLGDPSYDKTRLNPDFTFDTLVTGRANDLARAAAQ